MTIIHPGDWMREQIGKTGMGLRKFCWRNGIDFGTLSRLLNGRIRFTYHNSVKISLALGVDFREVLNVQDRFQQSLAPDSTSGKSPGPRP